MKVFRFDQAVGRNITAFDCHSIVMSRIVQVFHPTQIGCMHIGDNGCVGFHQASSKQLFLVVQGEGWVAGEDRNRIPIAFGQAAFWDQGEWHESGSTKGMTAIVIESSNLEPEKTMEPHFLHQ